MTTQTWYEAALDHYSQLRAWGEELVEQGDIATARRVFSEANKAYPFVPTEAEWAEIDTARWWRWAREAERAGA